MPLGEGVTASASGSIEKAVSALDGRDGDIVVILGRQSLAESPDSVVQAAAALAALPDVKFLSALRRGNVRGALELGLTPGFLPGRVTLDAARDHFTEAWGAVPAQAGLDAAGILEAAAAGSIHALVLLGAEPEQDFPDRIRMRAGLDAVPFVVAVGAFATDAAARRRVPARVGVGREGRHQHQPRGSGAAPGAHSSRPRARRWTTGASPRSWRRASTSTSASRPSRTCRTRSPASRRRSPASTPSSSAAARDGAVLPIADFPDEIVFHHVLGVTTGRSWEPIKPGVAADESHLSALGTGAVAASGTGSDPIKPGLASGEAPEEDDEAAEEVVEAAAEELGEPRPRSTCGTARSRRRWRCRRTRTVSASWPPARSTTPDAWSPPTPALAELATGGALVVHPSDLSRIGVSAEGDDVRVTTPRGTVTRRGAGRRRHRARHRVHGRSRQGGDVGPNDIVDIAASVTELRVETAR